MGPRIFAKSALENLISLSQTVQQTLSHNARLCPTINIKFIYEQFEIYIHTKTAIYVDPSRNICVFVCACVCVCMCVCVFVSACVYVICVCVCVFVGVCSGEL